MISFSRIIFINLALIACTSCSQILESVEIPKFSEAQLTNSGNQDDFEISLKTLTLSEAKKAKETPYVRNVMMTGSGQSANIVEEKSLLTSKLPPELKPKEYVLGIGDELTYVQYQNAIAAEKIIGLGDLENIKDKLNDNLIITKGRIGSDGAILLLGLGRLNAIGRSINDLRSEVRNILIRNGLEPSFQLEITDFLSKKAFVFSSTGGDGVIPITERPLSLKELAAKAGYKTLSNTVNLITLTRNKNVYRLSNKDLFDENRKEIFIQDKDQIKLENYEYKPGQVYALSGGNANIIPINPSVRQTMADVMFIPGGPLSNQLAKRSEVYLLRGNDPITAFHLDAQNASKIIVAAAMELRPSDIIYVAERPIISFARLLNEVTPLRLLLSDIRAESDR